MARGGRVTGKRSCRKRVRSKEPRSDDSDEDYVVSDAGGDASDCPENDRFSLDGCEDSLDDFIEDEEEEEVQVRKFNRSRAKNGVRHRQKNVSKTSRKRSRSTSYDEQLEQEDEDDDEQESDGDDDSVEKDGDFSYEDDEEFTPEEEDYSEEEEGTVGRKKKNNGMKTGKKASRKKVSATSSRGKKRRGSRVSKKPLRKRRRKNGGSRRKVQQGHVDGFIDNGSKNSRRVRRRLVLEDSDSDSVSKSSDHEFTISEEERQQVREAKELCGSLKRNQRSASLQIQIKNEEVGVHENLHQQWKPRGRKGKEKIEEFKGRKGKEKVEDLKVEVAKQVCGICLSEENKRRVRGILNCCTHYYCFACIMEWSKVESRCPLCKQRFNTISKSTRPTTPTDLREVVIQVPERNQVYEPTEEELRSYIDPYETVFCSECHEGGDEDLMLLCDMCDSPAHTYCVGLGREVPEGNWYCDGCRPVALASSNSQVQECPISSGLSLSIPPFMPSSPIHFRRDPSPVLHLREIIDLNLTSSPRTSFSQGFGHLSSSRFSSRSVEGASGGGAPTLSERRWIHRHIQQLLSIDRMMTSTTVRTNSSMRNLHCSQTDQSREPATQHTRAQDENETSQLTFFERLSNDISPLMQNRDPFSIRISNSRTTELQNSTLFANMPLDVDRVIWPGLLVSPTFSNYEPLLNFSSISEIATDGTLSPPIKEESNFHMVEEQLQLMVKSHLKNLSPDFDLGISTFKDIERSSTHTILAACGLEHKKSEVCICTVDPPSACPHIELMAGGQISIVKGCCSSCFDSFVGDVVKRILEDTRMSSQWLRLGL